MVVRSRLVTLAAGALVVAGSCLPAAPAAAATAVRCGDTLTRDTVLKRDLTCAGDGLTLSPGVRLDLDGHRLRGDGTGTGVRALGSNGAALRDGRIVGWNHGLEFEGETPYPDQRLTIDKVTFEDAPVSVVAAVTTVNRSSFVRSDLAIYENIFTADRTTFDRSSTVGELNTVTIRRSTVRAAGVAVDENNRVAVIDSTLDGTGAPREAVGCFGTRSIVRSTIRDYATPLYTYDICPTLVDGSSFTDNPGGALLSPEGGPASVYLVVTDSTFRRNLFGVKGSGVSVTSSTFDRNGVGVQLTDGDGSVVASSTFTRQTGSGVLVDDGRASVGGVRADRNQGYGIYAPGAVDLGGNSAEDNVLGDCVGVTCAG